MPIFVVLTKDEIYMHRCLQLAALGKGHVAPNPMVGALLVYNDHIIGEGYHRQYGEAHAEVNCIHSVPDDQKYLIKESTLYVSLEPCNHFGKTAPCADLILDQKIPKLVIACKDPFHKVNGTGIEKLLASGVEVVLNVLEKEAIGLNNRFFTFHTKKRPYIILKWAQSDDLKMAGENSRQVKISNEITDRLVHKWRSEEAAIMVGTNTALIDDPSLTTRLWHGHDALRVVIDNDLRLPASLNLFDKKVPTIVINKKKEGQSDCIFYCKYNDPETIPEAVIRILHGRNINSILIEGGQALLQTFIDSMYWDEARVITNKSMQIGEGLNAPQIKNASIMNRELILTDEIAYYKRNET